MSPIKTGDECPCPPVQKESEIVQFFFSLNDFLGKRVCLKSSWIQRVTPNQWRPDSRQLQLRRHVGKRYNVWDSLTQGSIHGVYTTMYPHANINSRI